MEKRSVDFVVPMVFPDDPEWVAEWERCHSGGGVGEHVRWRSWGTEEIMVRGVMRYMPWLRRVYILLARESQVQPWMSSLAKERHDIDVKILFHKDFIPSDYLPCFTSPTIEMFLHWIPDLSERFIYANDDMYALSPLQETDFFVDGKPCQRMFEKPFPAAPNVFERKCMYQLNMIGRDFGRRFDGVWLKNGHTFAPILKSSCEAVWARHGTEIRSCLSPIRRTERSFNHYIYVYWQEFSGNCFPKVPRRIYAGKGTTVEKLREILATDKGIICINDSEKELDWRERAQVVRESLALQMDNG